MIGAITPRKTLGALDARPGSRMDTPLWPLYVILYGLFAGAGVALSVLVAITVVALSDATRVNA